MKQHKDASIAITEEAAKKQFAAKDEATLHGDEHGYVLGPEGGPNADKPLPLTPTSWRRIVQ